MKKAIIIPTYLKLNQPDELPFSDGLKLAKRAVESLKRLEDQDFTLILPVCFDFMGEIKEEAFPEMTGFVSSEMKRLRSEKILVFGHHQLRNLRDYLDRLNVKQFSSLIDLKGFSRIRNTGLLIVQGLSIDIAIFIDNDEVLEDPQYLRVASEYVNEKWDGKIVHGKGGFYVNPDDTILLPPQGLWWRVLWNKTKWMNRVWEGILSSKERLVQSPMLLGGNLVLHRDLFSHVPFDPYIPRGEDTDYLINASQLGFSLFFDKQLRVKHLHPERTETYFEEELSGDIERFLYEREKIRIMAMSRINLDPYPGHFLRWMVYPKAGLTSLFLSLDYLVKQDWKKAGRSVSNISLLFKGQGRGVEYLKFRENWEKVMGEIGNGGMRGILDNCRI